MSYDVITKVELKCGGCGASLDPDYGELVITCAYCGTKYAIFDARGNPISLRPEAGIRIAPQRFDSGSCIFSRTPIYEMGRKEPVGWI